MGKMEDEFFRKAAEEETRVAAQARSSADTRPIDAENSALGIQSVNRENESIAKKPFDPKELPKSNKITLFRTAIFLIVFIAFLGGLPLVIKYWKGAERNAENTSTAQQADKTNASTANPETKKARIPEAGISALKALKKLALRTQAGISKRAYDDAFSETYVDVKMYINETKDKGLFSFYIEQALEAFQEAKRPFARIAEFGDDFKEQSDLWKTELQNHWNRAQINIDRASEIVQN